MEPNGIISYHSITFPHFSSPQIWQVWDGILHLIKLLPIYPHPIHLFHYIFSSHPASFSSFFSSFSSAIIRLPLLYKRIALQTQSSYKSQIKKQLSFILFGKLINVDVRRCLLNEFVILIQKKKKTSEKKRSLILF